MIRSSWRPQCTQCGGGLAGAWEGENPSTFSPICNPSRSRQPKFSDSASKDMEAVEVPLPISMHTGQIILLTKLLTGTGLDFYDLEGDVATRRWRSQPSGSS